MPTRLILQLRPRTLADAKLYFGALKSVLEVHDGLYTHYVSRGRGRAIDAATASRLQLTLRGAGRFRFPATAVEACLGGQFLVETAAGRDALASGIVNHIAAIGVRNGLDGLLLTCLYHLRSTHSDQLNHAMDVWHSTQNTVKTGLVVFNSEIGEVARLATPAFDPANDPFAGGVEGPAWQQTLTAKRGGDVMDVGCQAWFTAGGMILGGVGGAAAGGVTGGVGGALGGLVAGASAGADIGGAIGGVACVWIEADKPTPDPSGTKGGGFKDDESIFGAPTDQNKSDGGLKDDEDHNSVFNNNSSSSDSSSNSSNSSNETKQDASTTTEEKDSSSDQNPGFPPPNDAFPPPDDDGSGNPWAVVGTHELSAQQVAGLTGQSIDGVYRTTALQPITVGDHALNPSQTLLGNITMKAVGTNTAVQQARLLNLIKDLSLGDVSVPDLAGQGGRAQH